MTGAPGASPKRSTPGLRALATSYRTRLLLAILLVVAVALMLVLLSLPRLLDPYFGGQELRNLQSRAETMATLIASELDRAAREGATHPLLQPDGSATFTTLGTLGDDDGGFVRDLTNDIALADVSVQVARTGAAEPAHRLDILFPDEAAQPGQGREAIAASVSTEVDDVFYAPSSDVSPSLVLTVTLSNPFTFREETARTITEVLITAALIALVVALITALLLAQWLARPLRRLTQTSRLLAEGHLDARVDMPRNSAPEVQELAGAFNDMAERLQQSVTIISEDRDRGREFLADVSHELRTPIAALRTFNELLLEGAGEDPETRDEFLRQSRQQVERLDWF
ncbi:MAG: histidine kinase dimerization/phospho-acceptor domain-containing protein, partial [Chloroflexota bacterium]